MLRRIAMLVVFFAPAIPALAQPAKTPAKTPDKAPATKPEGELSVRLINGSVLQQATLIDVIEVETKLGKITIPAGEIKKIDFGFRLPEEETKKVEQALKDLGSDTHATREAATKLLLGMGKSSYPFLVEQRKKGGDLETTRRLDGLIKDIQGKFMGSNILTRRSDIIRTSDSSLAGKIVSTD